MSKKTKNSNAAVRGRTPRRASKPFMDPKKSAQRSTAAQRSQKESARAPQLRVIPLGGLDAIGKNMTAFVCGDDMVLIDAGLMFPDDEHPGVDLILPDYTYVLEHEEKLRGIVITHGHEDHTGALPYLLKDLDRTVPVYGTKLTLGLIEGKLEEHRIVRKADMHEVHRGGREKLGCFDLEFFMVNHSIPGAMGIFMKTPAGNVLHTGDFKLDQTPIDGELTDFGAIARFSHEGVDLLMSDSTNANVKEFTRSEADVGIALRQIIGQAKQRVIVASFASHIHRIQQICDAALLAGRKVAVTGRSMLTNTRIARELGYLHVPDELIVDSYDVSDMPPDKTVVLCTGSQGEPLSALARMSSGEHRTLSIERGDTVIISATPVPGNEKSVTRVINQLSKIGADVYDKRRAMVHVSGHAASEELKIVLSLVRPKYFMPVHGEASHLRAHARLAEAVGVKSDHIFIMDNGDSLLLKEGKVKRSDPVESGIVYVDGSSVGDIGKNVLEDRQSMSSEGVATAVVAVNTKTGKLVGEPVVMLRGIPGCDNDDFLAELRDVAAGAAEEAASAYAGLLRHAGGNNEFSRRVKKQLRDAVSKFIWQRCHRRPVIMSIVMEV